MIIRRAPRPRQFTIVAAELVNDRRLSADMLGVLLYLLSKPDNWQPMARELEKRFDMGRDRLRGVMRGLVAAGYAVLKPIKRTDGALAGQGYEIGDEPCADNDPREDENPSDEAERRDGHPPRDGFSGARPRDVFSDARETRRSEVTNIESKTNTPLPPNSGPAETAPPGDPPGDLDEDWRRFESLWPWKAGESRQRVRRAFDRLPALERGRVSEGVPVYRDWCRKSQRQPAQARTYVSQKLWEAVTPGSAPQRVFVRTGTPGWDAWRARRRAEGLSTPTTVARGEDGVSRQGWWFPTLFPPGEGATGPPGSG